MKKVAFIINGKQELTPELSARINDCKKSSKLAISLFYTKSPKDAIRMAKTCTDESFDVVLAVGGDGTINEVLNGCMQSEKSLPILGIVPLGTGNDFIRSISPDYSTCSLRDALEENQVQTFDFVRMDSTVKTNYFINIADVGFGGKVIEILDKQRAVLGGKMSYAVAILRAFASFKRPEIELQTPNFNYSGEALMVAFCKGNVFGNGLTINPYAKINDGKLYITLLGKVTLLDYVRNLKKLKKGVVIEHPHVHYWETESLNLRITKGYAVGEMDGEFFNDTNCTVTVISNQLRFLMY
jgi:diacylglycerol kinase (ATP)